MANPLIPRSIDEQARLAARLQMPSAGVWGYVRVSSDAQEDGQSPEVQEQDILRYAKEMGLAQPMIVRETASAGNPMLSVSLPGAKSVDAVVASPRPLLLMLIGHLIEHVNQHLIVWKLDRLSRVQYEQEMLLEMMRKKHVVVHSTQVAERQLLSGDPSAVVDPARVFFRQILGAVAQYERAVIRLRVGAGLRMKASKGGWVGGHHAFGYDVAESDLVVNKEEAKLVCEIFYYRDECSLSYDRIASLLRDRGMHDWHKVRVSRIIHNRDLYNGIYIDPYGGRHQRPDLRILPSTWMDWVERTQPVIPAAAERLPTYGEES